MQSPDAPPVPPDLQELAAFTIKCVILFCTLQFSLSTLKIPQTQINCLVSLFHHVTICAYSFLKNFQFMILLQSSFQSVSLPCDTSLFSTHQIYYSGIFTIVYLAYDTIFDLFRSPSKNKLLIFHHFNGVFLVSYALLAHYGQYMVYICHVMEVSSIFLSMKDLLKYYGASEGIRLTNDLFFAASFLVVRIYVTLASVLMITGMYNQGCLTTESVTFLDGLIIYTTGLYVVLTTFWSYGIVKKVYGVLTGSKRKAKVK